MKGEGKEKEGRERKGRRVRAKTGRRGGVRRGDGGIEESGREGRGRREGREGGERRRGGEGTPHLSERGCAAGLTGLTFRIGSLEAGGSDKKCDRNKLPRVVKAIKHYKQRYSVVNSSFIICSTYSLDVLLAFSSARIRSCQNQRPCTTLNGHYALCFKIHAFSGPATKM